jgi:hypothetical protein
MQRERETKSALAEKARAIDCNVDDHTEGLVSQKDRTVRKGKGGPESEGWGVRWTQRER